MCREKREGRERRRRKRKERGRMENSAEIEFLYYIEICFSVIYFARDTVNRFHAYRLPMSKTFLPANTAEAALFQLSLELD